MSPINTGAFGGATSEPAKPEKTLEEMPKRTRRTKAQMIADAVVPAPDEMVKIKNTATGAEIERPWSEAVQLVSSERAEFSDKTMKYAVLKQEQGQQDFDVATAPESKTENLLGNDAEALTARWVDLQAKLDGGGLADEEVDQLNQESELVQARIVELGGEDPASDDSYAKRASDLGKYSGVKLGNTLSGNYKAPKNAQVGDIVVIDGDEYRVGHGDALISGNKPVSSDGEIVKAKSTWNLNDDGVWIGTAVPSLSANVTMKGNTLAPVGNTVVSGSSSAGAVTFKQTPLQGSYEQVGVGVFKVSAGYLEKIGLPDYSGLQIGPVSVQTTVLDDGRKERFTMGDGREVELPSAPVEGVMKCGDIAEVSMRALRQSVINFLESVKPGSTRPQ